MYTGVSSELQTLILNCILDITSYMSQRHLKFKLNVPKSKIIISLTPQNLVCFQKSPSESVHHPSSSTTQKPIMFDSIFLLYYFDISPSPAHFTSSVSLKTSVPLHLQHTTPPPPTHSHMDNSPGLQAPTLFFIHLLLPLPICSSYFSQSHHFRIQNQSCHNAYPV